MKRDIRNTKGFTLIELMIVVVIIGILASLALPRFTAAALKSKQSEAKAILKQIYVNQSAYREQAVPETYFNPAGPASVAAPDEFNEIWIIIMPSARYTYEITADASTFTATATCDLDGDATIDTWTINNAGVLLNTINDVQA